MSPCKASDWNQKIWIGFEMLSTSCIIFVDENILQVKEILLDIHYNWLKALINHKA